MHSSIVSQVSRGSVAVLADDSVLTNLTDAIVLSSPLYKTAMARNLYALLVGINEYDERSRVPHLRGCVNDVHGIHAYLQGRVAQDDFELKPLLLLNEQATRQSIVDGFRQHLAQAGSEDVVLFYYAGHGAQADAPEAFWPVSPDRMMETLVCYDSRVDDDHWDLADKELSKLIADVSANNPHISVVLDCCHSGSGTRDGVAGVATRRAQPDKRPRPLDSFLISPTDLASSAQASTTRSLDKKPVAINLPLGRHVVLAACRNIEEAKEYRAGDVPHGAFSFFLQETLNKANGSLTYRDLFKRTNALIRSGVPAQSPQLDATHSEDLEMPFLGGAIAPSPPSFAASYNKDHGWVIDGGAIHGLQSPSGDESTVLALYPFDADVAQLKNVSAALAQVKITKVLPQLSKIDAVGDRFTDHNNVFKAVVVSSPLPPLSVYLSGNMVGAESLRRAIASAGPNGESSLYVKASEQLDGSSLQVTAENNTYTIVSVADKRPLVASVESYDTASAVKVVEDLEHIARWKTIAELSSPASSQIRGGVELKIYSGEEASPEAATEINSSQIRLRYQYNADSQDWTPPRFRIKLSNTSDKTLYCALFYLTERFKAAVIKPDGVASWVRLLPGQEIWFANGAALNGTVADVLWNQGITECQDILKLIACTDEFDPSLMMLSELGVPQVATRSAVAGGGNLNRLMQRVNTREISFAGEPQVYDDWVANQVAFTFVRPRSSVSVAGDSVDLGAGVFVQGHSDLKADVRLTTVEQSTRDLGGALLPPLLQNDSEPFQFTSSRASDPGLSALELNNVSNPEAITAEKPLLITADMPLAEGEYVLPVAYDGEFYLPLGYGKNKDGKTQIVIERLTEPVSEGNRSITGSIRIFFQKVIAKKLKREFEYPLLRMAELETLKVDKAPEVVYKKDVETLKARVAEAQNIVICIHGIFGNTASMLPSLEMATTNIKNDDTPIGELYDLVLAFDYENLNTRIDRNARSLKERLEAIGLGAGHDKTLHIVAHSMGGLVSRWFIEREGGHEIVSHLIMLGTPNNGSPWPQVQAGITTAISYALNGLSLAIAPLRILEGLLRRIEAVDVSLDQMQPGSDFLKELASSADPGVPYTLVVGNTSLVPSDAASSLKKKIMQRLGKLVEIPFFSQSNDIAVLVNSIMFVPEERSPAPKKIPTACNHLEYFSHPKGLASLTEAVLGTGIAGDQTVNANATATATEEPMPVASKPNTSEPQLPDTAPVSAGPTSAATRSVPTAQKAMSGTLGVMAAGAVAGSSQDDRSASPDLPKFPPLPPVEDSRPLNTPVDDEPSPFIEDNPGAQQSEPNALSKPWVWLLAVGLAGILIFVWAQRPASTPVKPDATETIEPEG